MTFDDWFVADPYGTRCLLWADEAEFGRVRFSIAGMILEDVLGGVNAVHDDRNVALCERERTRIEAACVRAFARQPATDVAVEAIDFEGREEPKQLGGH